MKKSDKMRQLIKSLKPAKKELKAADVNKDGKVDEKDLSAVYKAYHEEKAEEKKESKPKKKKEKKEVLVEKLKKKIVKKKDS